jgi:hypothetical protein
VGGIVVYVNIPSKHLILLNTGPKTMLLQKDIIINYKIKYNEEHLPQMQFLMSDQKRSHEYQF